MRFIFSDDVRLKIIEVHSKKKQTLLDVLSEFNILNEFNEFFEYHKDSKLPLKELIYHFLMDDSIELSKHKCLYCGGEVKRFYPHKMEYAPYCCKKCSDMCPIKHQHEADTNLKLYGKTRWNNREQSAKTCEKKYGKGITNPSQVQYVKDKKNLTTNLHFGVDNPGQISNHHEKCTNAWNNKSIEEKKKILHNRHIHTNYEQRYNKTKNTLQKLYGENITNVSQLDFVKEKKALKKQESLRKAKETIQKKFQENYNYMKSTYNISPKHGGVISNIEMNFYEYLISKFNKDDIVPQYTNNELYPFNCDFYIKSQDIYIEINGHWTHGDHPFDENNINDILTLNEWINKSKESLFYTNAIHIWTHIDVKKRETAKCNNLKYIEIFTDDIDTAIRDFETYLYKKSEA